MPFRPSPSAPAAATDGKPPPRRPSYGLWAALLLSVAAGLGYLAWRESRRPQVLLRVDRPRIDLGEVSPKTTIPLKFTLGNDGLLPIEIMSVESSCACTAATLTSPRIPPGGDVPLDATLTTATDAGPFSTTVAVMFRGQGQSQLYRQILEIRARIRSSAPASAD